MIWKQRNIAGYLTTPINIHISCGNSNQLTSCVEHSTKSIITVLDAMFSDVIDLWWKKIPPTLASFWCRIERKRSLKKGRSSLSLKTLKKRSLSLSLRTRHQDVDESFDVVSVVCFASPEHQTPRSQHIECSTFTNWKLHTSSSQKDPSFIMKLVGNM